MKLSISISWFLSYEGHSITSSNTVSIQEEYVLCALDAG